MDYRGVLGRSDGHSNCLILEWPVSHSCNSCSKANIFTLLGLRVLPRCAGASVCTLMEEFCPARGCRRAKASEIRPRMTRLRANQLPTVRNILAALRVRPACRCVVVVNFGWWPYPVYFDSFSTNRREPSGSVTSVAGQRSRWEGRFQGLAVLGRVPVEAAFRLEMYRSDEVVRAVDRYCQLGEPLACNGHRTALPAGQVRVPRRTLRFRW